MRKTIDFGKKIIIVQFSIVHICCIVRVRLGLGLVPSLIIIIYYILLSEQSMLWLYSCIYFVSSIVSFSHNIMPFFSSLHLCQIILIFPILHRFTLDGRNYCNIQLFLLKRQTSQRRGMSAHLKPFFFLISWGDFLPMNTSTGMGVLWMNNCLYFVYTKVMDSSLFECFYFCANRFQFGIYWCKYLRRRHRETLPFEKCRLSRW